MAFPVAPQAGFTPPVLIWPTASTPNALAANKFIPEIWSGKLIEKFYASTVLAAISNTDYEGEIKNQGDKVIIRTKPTITIRPYAADGMLTVDRPEGGNTFLLIDKGDYFNLALDDVMRIQSDVNLLDIWSDDAGEQMKIVVDRAVLLGMLHQAAAANRGITAGILSGDVNLGVTGTPLAVVGRSPTTGQVEILDVLLRLGQVLDEQNIPESGRWVVLPAWAAMMLKQSELRQAYLTGDSVSPLRNGRIGQIDRFTIYVSNLLPRGSVATPVAGLADKEQPIYAGHAHGLTFASQFTNVETLRSEMSFATLLRGLQIYGWKILDSVAIAEAIVLKAP
jgi:hypothetical protein